jgi:hypothetical protein
MVPESPKKDPMIIEVTVAPAEARSFGALSVTMIPSF